MFNPGSEIFYEVTHYSLQIQHVNTRPLSQPTWNIEKVQYNSTALGLGQRLKPFMLNKYGGFLLHSTKIVTRLWTGVTVVSRRVPSEVTIAFLTSGAASSAAGHCPFPGAAVSELR